MICQKDKLCIFWSKKFVEGMHISTVQCSYCQAWFVWIKSPIVLSGSHIRVLYHKESYMFISVLHAVISDYRSAIKCKIQLWASINNLKCTYLMSGNSKVRIKDEHYGIKIYGEMNVNFRKMQGRWALVFSYHVICGCRNWDCHSLRNQEPYSHERKGMGRLNATC